MLTREDVVEIVALHRRGWSISAIARHTGRDRTTVRAWLRGERRREARRQPSPLEPYRAYLAQRLADDPHLDATVLLRELRALGFEQDGTLRRFGGTARSWRTDRMASVVAPQSGRLRPEAAELAKHYGVTVSVCPPRRAQRKGVVEAAIRYLERSWWRSAEAATPAQAQASLDRWCAEVADRRRRGRATVGELAGREPLLPLPPQPYPAELDVERLVGASALVRFEGNRYSVPPAYVGQRVRVRLRLGEPTLQIVSAAGVLVARHRRIAAGAGQLARKTGHADALEQAVLAAFTTRPPCRRKQNRPPSEQARRLAATLGGQAPEPTIPSLSEYASLAGGR